MTKEFAYALHDKVKITELESNGRVTALYVCNEGVQYRVRYFYNGEAKNEYFFADEICAL